MDESLAGSSNTLAAADSAGGSPIIVQRTAALSDANEDAFMEAATTRYYLQDDRDSQSSCCWRVLSRMLCFEQAPVDPLTEELLETPVSEAAPEPSTGTIWCGFLCCDNRKSAPERHTLPRLSSTILGLGRMGGHRLSSPTSPVARLRASSSHTDSLPYTGTPQPSLSLDRSTGQVEVVRKIVMLGARNSGKSSVVHRIADKRFGTVYDPTIESTVRTKIPIGGVIFVCDLLDTAGQDEYSNFSRQATVGVHGYCMVFSITSMQSFIAIQKIYERITELVGSYTVPIVLVGTKSDDELHREVNTRHGESLAESWGAPYIECSAKSDYGIKDIFETLLLEIERDSGLLATRDSEDTENVSRRSSFCTIS